MNGYDGEGTIPAGGFRESFRIYRERVYGSKSLARFFGQGLLLAASPHSPRWPDPCSGEGSTG